MRTRFLSLAVAASLAAPMMAPAVAMGQQPTQIPSEKQAQAEQMANKAFEAYQKGDYTTALSLYQSALQIQPAAAIYFNIASIYDKKLPDAQLAIDFYRKSIGAPDATPELTIKATARVQVLQQDLAAKNAQGSKGEPAKGEPAKAPAQESDPGKGQRVAGAVIGGVGVVSLGVGLVFGLSARSKLNSAKESCDGKECKTQQGVDEMKSASTAGNVATVLSIVGGVGIAAGLGVYLLAPGKQEQGASVRLAPAVGMGQAGFSLAGKFLKGDP